MAPPVTLPEGLTAAPPRRPARRVTLALGGAAVLLLVCLTAMVAPWITPHDPRAQLLERRRRPPAWRGRGAWTHCRGTDHRGRDSPGRSRCGSPRSRVGR